jgi:branched-chain amino acid transport system permease protein
VSAIFVAGVAVLALVPLFVAERYFLFVANLALIQAIIASGLNITNGYLGILNLSVAGQVAIGAYVCALLSLSGAPITVAIIAAAAAGGCVAAIVFGIFTRLQGFFFGLATIAASEIIRILLRNFDGLTNGVRGLYGYRKLVDDPRLSYLIALGILAVIVALLAALMESSIGLQWKAIRENQAKAASLGIPVAFLRFTGFTLSGIIMSLGGALLALHVQFIDPNIASLNTLIQTILMVTLGGIGTIMGPIIGAMMITILPEFLRMANELRLVVYGAMLIVVVLALPGGIMNSIDRIRSRKNASLQSTRAVP